MLAADRPGIEHDIALGVSPEDRPTLHSEGEHAACVGTFNGA